MTDLEMLSSRVLSLENRLRWMRRAGILFGLLVVTGAVMAQVRIQQLPGEALPNRPLVTDSARNSNSLAELEVRSRSTSFSSIPKEKTGLPWWPTMPGPFFWSCSMPQAKRGPVSRSEMMVQVWFSTIRQAAPAPSWGAPRWWVHTSMRMELRKLRRRPRLCCLIRLGSCCGGSPDLGALPSIVGPVYDHPCVKRRREPQSGGL